MRSIATAHASSLLLNLTKEKSKGFGIDEFPFDVGAVEALQNPLPWTPNPSPAPLQSLTGVVTSQSLINKLLGFLVVRVRVRENN
ncbi:hypothetical protein D0Y65_000242 [Glycine soja]|uniref:Uncharacterized protein n=1 Tax=Glycine soja TaxID=3848 RepID=A0A445LXU7_GLYSO|nr:hypothetical protein D0Y65_000242 [Glycine soja]